MTTLQIIQKWFPEAVLENNTNSTQEDNTYRITDKFFVQESTEEKDVFSFGIDSKEGPSYSGDPVKGVFFLKCRLNRLWRSGAWATYDN